jgi:hypothetical protein
MKKVSLLICLLALAIGASASTLNLSSLQATTVPLPVPAGFAGFDWVGVDYVSPAWAGATEGFRLGADADDVLFGGRPVCFKEAIVCYASISAKNGFHAISAKAAAANGTNMITVTAYRNGTFVGSQQYTLNSGIASTLKFPAGWGVITELMIRPSSASQFVLYDLNAAMVGPHN